MRHSFKSSRHIHMITLPSGRVIKSDYDIPAQDEELGNLDVTGTAINEGTKAVKSGKAGSKPKKALESASKGAATGAVIGSVVPGVGTAIGAGVGALVGGISSLFEADKGPPDFFGHGMGGYYGDKVKALLTGDLARQGTAKSKKELAKRIAKWQLEYDIKYGMVPPDTTLETIAQVVKNQGGVSLRGKYKKGKWADGYKTSEYPNPGSKTDSEPLDVATIKESIVSGSLSKSDIQDALSQVLSALENKKQAKQNLLSSISKNTNKNLSSIKKTLLRNALSNEATSEHNKRMKEDVIIRRNNSKQNLMLNRLSAIETALKIKKAKGKALASAFGIPDSYV